MTSTVRWRATVLLLAVGALGVSSGAAFAQGPRPEPAPKGVGGGVQPEPVQPRPTAPPPAVAARVVQSSSAPQQAQNGSVTRFRAPVARASSDRPARVRTAPPPKKKAVARAARQAPVAKATKHVERVVTTVARKAAAPDRNLLLLGGAALLVLALGEALFLTLSVRFLRTTAEP